MYLVILGRNGVCLSSSMNNKSQYNSGIAVNDITVRDLFLLK